MGDIGQPVRHIEILPLTEPVEVPATPAPVKEPSHA